MRTSHEDFTSCDKSYFHDRCRTKFQARTEMCESYDDNFKFRTLARREEEDRDPGLQWCGDCGQAMDTQTHTLYVTQSHYIVCPAWTVARDRLDINYVVRYFQRVLRVTEDKKDRRTQGE